LDDDLGIGDVVVAERVIHHDAGVLEPDGFTVYQAGHVPFFNPTDRLGYRPSDDFLGRVRGVIDKGQLAPVLGRRPAVVFGTVVTGDQYVHAESVRRRLQATFAARAVEMEGAAVAQVAEHFGVDWLVVRALSDLAGGGASLDFNRFLDEVAANSVLVVRQVLSVL
jgi:adenosylhomocysteine nucleosidase